jgi:hypothetical protein
MYKDILRLGRMINSKLRIVRFAGGGAESLHIISRSSLPTNPLCGIINRAKT